MSYVAYEDITSPNEVVEHISEYVKSKGYTVVQDYADDNDIYGGSITDGKKLVFKDKTGNYYINLRSCNGYQIFGSGDESYQDTLNANDFKDEYLRGVGMTVSEGYSSATRWYNQYRVPNKFKTDELLGVYMPVPSIGEGDIEEVPMPEEVQKPDDMQEPVMPSYPSRPVEPVEPKDAIYYQNLTESVNDLVNLKLADGHYSEGSKWIVGERESVDKVFFYIKHNQLDHVYEIIPNGKKIINNGRTYELVLSSFAFNVVKVDGNYYPKDSEEALNSFFEGIRKLNNREGYFCHYYEPDETEPVLKLYTVEEFYSYIYTYESTIRVYFPGTDHWYEINSIYYFPDGPKGIVLELRLDFLDSSFISSTLHSVRDRDEYKEKKEQYDKDIVEYNTQVEKINSQYADEVKAYDKYLNDLAKYNSYLEQLKLYNSYLEKLASIRYRYTLYCNEVISDDKKESTLVFSLVRSNHDWNQVSHLIVGNLDKYEKWSGGIYFSGSANRYNMKQSIKLYGTDTKTNDYSVYPILSSGKESNTFLRIDIDNATSDSRGNIYWASSGEDNITGKKLSLPIRTGNGTIPYGNGEIPHFYYLQSHSRLDSGRNVNTLNCITLNLPIFMAVCVDPDDLQNYAAVGEVRGVYFISMFNLQTSSVYTINRPDSTESCQGFSVGRRRGNYGFDGISILQQGD